MRASSPEAATGRCQAIAGRRRRPRSQRTSSYAPADDARSGCLRSSAPRSCCTMCSTWTTPRSPKCFERSEAACRQLAGARPPITCTTSGRGSTPRPAASARARGGRFTLTAAMPARRPARPSPSCSPTMRCFYSDGGRQAQTRRSTRSTARDKILRFRARPSPARAWLPRPDARRGRCRSTVCRAFVLAHPPRASRPSRLDVLRAIGIAGDLYGRAQPRQSYAHLT